jgi:hypothetical protein
LLFLWATWVAPDLCATLAWVDDLWAVVCLADLALAGVAGCAGAWAKEEPAAKAKAAATRARAVRFMSKKNLKKKRSGGPACRSAKRRPAVLSTLGLAAG